MAKIDRIPDVEQLLNGNEVSISEEDVTDRSLVRHILPHEVEEREEGLIGHVLIDNDNRPFIFYDGLNDQAVQIDVTGVHVAPTTVVVDKRNVDDLFAPKVVIAARLAAIETKYFTRLIYDQSHGVLTPSRIHPIGIKTQMLNGIRNCCAEMIMAGKTPEKIWMDTLMAKLLGCPTATPTFFGHNFRVVVECQGSTFDLDMKLHVSGDFVPYHKPDHKMMGTILLISDTNLHHVGGVRTFGIDTFDNGSVAVQHLLMYLIQSPAWRLMRVDLRDI